MRSTRMSPGIRSNRTSRLAQLLLILAPILLPEAKHPHKPTDHATTVLRMTLLHLLSISANGGFLTGSAMATTTMRRDVRFALFNPPNLTSQVFEAPSASARTLQTSLLESRIPCR